MNPLLHFEIEPAKLFIAGRWQGSVSASTVQAINPSSGAAVCDIADANESDIDAAVAAAAMAMRTGWGCTSITDRCLILDKMADAIRDSAEALAKIEANDAGLVLRDAKHATSALAGACQQYATVLKTPGDAAGAASGTACSIRHPLGVVAVVHESAPMLPVLADTVCAVLAAGNACVLIVTDQVALSALAFAALVDVAGFPAGSFNVVSASQRDVRHSVLALPQLDAAIHSSPAWQSTEFHQRAAGHGKLVLASHFGKCMHVLFNADCDPATTKDHTSLTRTTDQLGSLGRHIMRDAMRYAGQHTSAASVVFVERRDASVFVPRLQKLWAGVEVGPALLSGDIGPLATVETLHAYSAFIESLRPARILAITGAGPDSGYYTRPALVNATGMSPEELAAVPNGTLLLVVLFDDIDDLARTLELHRAATAVTLWCASDQQKSDMCSLLDTQKIVYRDTLPGAGVTASPDNPDGERFVDQSICDAREAVYAFTQVKRIWPQPGNQP